MPKDDVHAAMETVAVVFEIIENIARIRDKYPDAQAEAERTSREYMAGALQKMGLDVSFDGGSIFATLPGTDAALPAVALVSSLSFSPAAGKYSGVLAAAGAAAVAARLAKDKAGLSHPVQVIILGDESPGNLRGKIKAFLELNVEYGGYLAREEVALGIVGAIALPTKLKITVETDACERLDKTPLSERQDALVSAAMLVLAVRNIAAQDAENGIVATVESISTPLAGDGLIPARAEMRVDIRGVKHDNIIEVLQEIKDEASAISEEQNVKVSIAVLSSRRPARLDGDIGKLMEEACRKHKISYEHLDSLAEYAAARMTGVADGALALIPCRRKEDNLSEEIVDKADIEGGIKVLNEVLRLLAE